MQPFLRSTEVIDWEHPAVLARAKKLSSGTSDVQEIARRCFEWVRDSIEHSCDFQRNPVTCSASEVLGCGTGYCFAKSHLLAALLRANGIPAGFCYQRLSINDNEAGSPYSLHGLNAVHLPEFGWYRIDARGNKPGVDARFTPPIERLAFQLQSPDEKLFPDILPDPLPVVVNALNTYTTWDDLYKHLPDWSLPSLSGRAAAASGD
jgi:transglutaminase-like putative cysteine protease